MSIREMTNQELADVYRTIKGYKEPGRLKYENDQAAFTESINKLAYETVPNISKGEKDFTPSQIMKSYMKRQRRKEEKKGTLREAGKRFLWQQMRAETILEWFNGWKRGPLLKATFDKLKKATEAESMMTTQDIAKFQEIHEGLEMARDMVKKSIDVTVDVTDPKGNVETFSDSFTLDEAMFIYAHSQNPNSYQHLTGKLEEGGEGLHPAVIDEIIEQMPESAKEAVDKMIDYYDTTVYDRLNAAYRELIGMDMPKEHRYFPIQRLNTDRAENAMVMDYLMRNSSRMTGPEKGMTKKRVKSIAPFDRMSYYGTVLESLKATNHMAAFGVPIKEVNAVLNHPDIKKAMTDRNETAYGEVQAWVKRVGYGKISQPGGAVAGLAESLRLAYVPAVLGGNLMTMMKQGTSLSMGIEMLENKSASMSKALAQWMKNPRAMTRFINQKSIFMADRRDSFERFFQEVAEKRFKQRILGAATFKDKSQKWIDNFKEFSLIGIKTVDSVTVNLLWIARYGEVLDKTGDESVAIEAADELIRKTQPTGGVLNLPSSFTGNAMERMYTMFMNQPNQNLQRMFEFGSKYGEEKTSRNLSKIFWRIALPSAIFYFMSNAFRKPHEDPEGWATEAARQVVGGVPIAGQMVLAAADVGTGAIKKARGKPWKKDPFLSDFSPSAFGMLEDLTKSVTNPSLSRTLETAAKFKGLPVVAYKRGQKAFEMGDWRYAIHSGRAIQSHPEYQLARKLTSSNRKERVPALREYNALPEKTRKIVDRHRVSIYNAKKRKKK